MHKYLFLDNWVLSDYTKNGRQEALSAYVNANEFTVVVNSLLLVEMFNPCWEGSVCDDRVSRAVRLLSKHHCVVLHPHAVIRAEIEAYPNRLEQLPADLDLDDIPAEHRATTLLRFLRGDDLFLRQGKDIGQWAMHYRDAKSTWLRDVDRIVEDGRRNGLLRLGVGARVLGKESHKEEFLRTLDRRHFEPEQIRSRGADIITLFLHGTANLPAVRFNSLCFWYAYIDVDKRHPLKKQGSDLGDLYQMSLIPYCSAFTIDGHMARVARRAMVETDHRCVVLSPDELESNLANRCQCGAVSGEVALSRGDRHQRGQSKVGG
jgi:hypothetical protein